jgi:cysteine desulfurase / selenocysteine lyase
MQTTADISILRKSFPILHQSIGGYPLVYFDNAATTQKPEQVINAIEDYYRKYNANIHRGAHHLAHIATEAYEGARTKVQHLINANEAAEIIFTSGTTDSINLVAQAWGRKFLQAGDEIVLSTLEHHSNIVPWQMVAEEKGAIIKVIPITPEGEWDLSGIDAVLSPNTKLVAVNHVSNALGTINPIKGLINKAHALGAVVMIDGAQAVPHMHIDVQELDCDFYAFSGHKMYGPTGVGCLYGKRHLLEAMSPYKGGGEMIKTVSFAKTTYNEIPFKFEAGTPHVEGVVGLGAAIDFMNEIGLSTIEEQEQVLLNYATEQLSQIDGLRIYGTSSNKAAVVSFLVNDIHPYDLGTLLDKQGVAVRTGHHCTQPLWDHYGVVGSVRASFAVYNTIEEIDVFIKALRRAVTMLG